MTGTRALRAVAGVALAAILVAALAAVFQAYLEPAHAVQWLTLLQLCR